MKDVLASESPSPCLLRYQFSLFYFLGLFGRSIDNAAATDDLVERLMILSRRALPGCSQLPFS